MLPRPPRSPLFPYTTLFRSAVEQVLVIRDHHRRIALGKGVHRVAPTEDGQHRLVETPQVHAGAREIRRQIEHHAAIHQRRNVDVVEQEDVGRRAGRHRREQALAILRLISGRVLLHDPEPRIGREVGREGAVFEFRLEVVGPVRELERDMVAAPAPSRRRVAAPQHDTHRERALHVSRSPATSNKCRRRRSSLTPTTSPGRSSTSPEAPATTPCPPATRCTNVSAPSGSTTPTAALPMPWSSPHRLTCSGRTPRWISPS